MCFLIFQNSDAIGLCSKLLFLSCYVLYLFRQAALGPYLAAVYGGGKKNPDHLKGALTKLNDAAANKQYLVGVCNR